MIRYTCPTCGKVTEVQLREEAPCRPFCCDHCQRIDLGRWFNGEYVISDPLNGANTDLSSDELPETSDRDLSPVDADLDSAG